MDGSRSCEQEGGLNRAASNDAKWEAVREIISDLYVTQNLPLSDVMKVMSRRGFLAT